MGSSGPKVPKEAKSNTFETTQGGTTALTCPGQSYPAPAFRFDTLIKFFFFRKNSQWSKMTKKNSSIFLHFTYSITSFSKKSISESTGILTDFGHFGPLWGTLGSSLG